MTVTLRIAVGLLACGLLSAAPPTCVTGTLASYIALGADGCTFDGNVFANFTYSATVTGGAMAIKPDQILVTPSLIAPETTVFKFSAPWSVARDQTEDSFIHYTIVLPCGDTRTAQKELMLGTAHVGSIIGSVTVTETTNVGKLSVYDRCTEVCQSKTVDSFNFNPVSVVLVTDHVSLSGGTGGVSLDEYSALVNLCYLCP